MLSRRTVVVLACLVGAMTLVSGLLLALEPGPMPPMAGISLSRTRPSLPPQQVLFNTAAPVKATQWSNVRVHFSGQSFGSARSLHEAHERSGLGGLGYHFVIGNGRGGDDGQITIGFRWQRQLQGIDPSVPAPVSRAAPDGTIHICLVGDPRVDEPTHKQMRELVWLVQQLQMRLEIDPQRVHVGRLDAGDAAQRLERFPMALFRQQLLAAQTP